MAEGQLTAQGINIGIQALFALIQYLGQRKTGMTGKEKMDHVVTNVLPIFEAGEAAVIGNQKNPTTQLEVAAAAQAIHQTLLVTGAIHETSTLESATAPVAPAPIVTFATPASPAPANPNTPVDQAKYNQWLRLATPGNMPSNETLRASLYVANDSLYNDGDASNAAEFYFVVPATLQGFVVPNSPTGRIAKYAGYVG